MDTRGPAVDELLAQYDPEQLAYMVVGLRVEAAYWRELAVKRAPQRTTWPVGSRVRKAIVSWAGRHRS